MSKTKAAGKTKNVTDSPGQRLGVKAHAGEYVTPGAVIIRQRGSKKIAGEGTKMGRDHTIYATREGLVAFDKTKVKRFTGKKAPRTRVSVVD